MRILKLMIVACALFASIHVISAEENQVVEPQAVVLKAEAINYKTIHLSWNKEQEATAYNIYRKSYQDEKFILMDTITECEYDFNVMTGKKYDFKVEAIKVVELDTYPAEMSNTVSCTTQLKGTVKLSITKTDSNRFKLSWNKIDGATRYLIYRRRGNDSYQKVLTLGGSDLSYTTNYMAAGTYTFIVRAGRYDSIDRVMTSNSNEVKSKAVFEKPTLKILSSNKTAELSWREVKGVQGYQIYRSTSKSGTYKKYKTLKENAYSASGLVSNKTYYFKVRGYRVYQSEMVYTSFSDVVSVKVK